MIATLFGAIVLGFLAFLAWPRRVPKHLGRKR
jgi:hypothetical protein